jgi:hypothetical protein
MLITIVSVIAIACLPGAVIFRLPIADRSTRAALPAEERLFWVLVISVIVTTTVALVLAAMGVYSLNAAIPAGLIALGVWMYFAAPGAEYVMGGRDPGVYVSEGIQIAQRQSLVTTDRVVAGVPAATRDLFFPTYSDPHYYSLRFMGFPLRDPQTGTVTGQFPQGYPIWIAIAYGLDGLTGTRRLTAWWAIFGVLAVYFAAKRLVGPLPAAAAAGLLCVHVIQTWYARYPNSEIVVQALLFAALLAHAYAHEDDDRFFGPVAASLLGLALFTRLPVVLVVGVVAAASLLPHVRGHRGRAGFFVTLAAWVIAAGAYYATQLRPYMGRTVTYAQSLQPIHLIALAIGSAAVCALIWASRKPRIAGATRTLLPLALITAVVCGGCYALFFREPGGRLAPHDAHAVRTFVHFYFTPMAFGLALAGYALVVWRSFWRAPALILTITILATVFFYKMRIWPEHFWLARRFLTEILPGALMFASAAIFAPLWMKEPGADSRRRAAFAAIGVVVAVLFGYRYVSASLPIREHVEYAGMIPRLERLASTFSDNDLVLVEGRAASDLHVLALPLSYIYARNVLVLHDSRPDKALVREFLTWAHERYDNVYFIAGGGTSLLSPGVGSLVVASESFQVPEYERTTYDTYPRTAVRKPFDFTIYKLVQTELTPPPQSLDVGGTDDLHLVDFYPKERLGGGNLTFRWSQHTSYLLMRVLPNSREVALRLSGGRPRGVPPPRVTVYLEGEELTSAEITNEFRDYIFPIPPATAANLALRREGVQVRMQSSTWVPRAVLGGSDTRALGVMIDRAEIR